VTGRHGAELSVRVDATLNDIVLVARLGPKCHLYGPALVGGARELDTTDVSRHRGRR
jgi:hypothetical protein